MSLRSPAQDLYEGRRKGLTERYGATLLPEWEELPPHVRAAWVRYGAEQSRRESPAPPWVTGVDEPRGPRFSPPSRWSGPADPQGSWSVEYHSDVKRAYDGRRALFLAAGGDSREFPTWEDQEERVRRAWSKWVRDRVTVEAQNTGDAKQNSQIQTLQAQVASHEKRAKYDEGAINNLRKRIVALEEKAGYTPPQKRETYKVTREARSGPPALEGLMRDAVRRDLLKVEGYAYGEEHVSGVKWALTTLEDAEEVWESLRNGPLSSALAPWEALTYYRREQIRKAVEAGILRAPEK